MSENEREPEQNLDALIHRYLTNRMEAVEQAEFEIRMLEQPELLERVQLLDSLQAALHSEKAALLAESEGSRDFRVLPLRDQVLQPFGLAASVLVAVLGLNALLRTPDNPPVARVLPVGALVLLEARRDDALPVFTGAGPYLFQVDAGFDAQVGPVALTLTEVSSNTLLLEEAVDPDTEGWARLLYTQPLDGEYRIDMQVPSGTEQPSYRFIVRNP